MLTSLRRFLYISHLYIHALFRKYSFLHVFPKIAGFQETNNVDDKL